MKVAKYIYLTRGVGMISGINSVGLSVMLLQESVVMFTVRKY